MIVRFKLSLSNPNAEQWVAWKDLEPELAKLMIQFECVELSREYDDANFEKVVVLQYESEQQLNKLLNKAGRLAGEIGLEVDMKYREIIDSPCQNLIRKHKKKYKVTLPF